jgi:hypothetical protein
MQQWTANDTIKSIGLWSVELKKNKPPPPPLTIYPVYTHQV